MPSGAGSASMYSSAAFDDEMSMHVLQGMPLAERVLACMRGGGAGAGGVRGACTTEAAAVTLELDGVAALWLFRPPPLTPLAPHVAPAGAGA